MRTTSRRRGIAAEGCVALAVGMLASAASPATAAQDQVLPFGTIAWTGSAVVITALGSNRNLYFWEQPAGAASPIRCHG